MTGSTDKMDRTNWATPAVIRDRVAQEWARGRLLAVSLTGEARYPWRLSLKGPVTAEILAAQYDVVRQWIKDLVEGAKAAEGRGYRLEFREIHHRQLGRNQLPVAAWLDTEDDALTLIGKRREAVRFRELAAMITQVFPLLQDWLAQRPLRVLDLSDDWAGLLGVLGWMADHPRPHLYLRQIDVPGVHSKFIERHRALLAELLDIILPVEAIDARQARGTHGFERRYGFFSKPLLIRFRLLDEPLHGMTDLTLPSNEFAQLDLPIDRVFITENEINFLAFPRVPGSLVIFGAGYGFEALAEAAWLPAKTILYWGDIDTHGFAILDQLRSHCPGAQSLLMDRETLMAHRSLWGREDTPIRRDLPRLQPDEAHLYDDLRYDRLGPALRLEQERIGFSWVQAVIDATLAAVSVKH
ncbi:MAG: Wadjet anti-phage system protein JetD domain-containing protein, partial [Pseudomonadota bacterium]